MFLYLYKQKYKSTECTSEERMVRLGVKLGPLTTTMGMLCHAHGVLVYAQNRQERDQK